MAVATIVEKYCGTDFAHSHFYGSWWFSLLWAVLTAGAILYFIRRKVKRFSIIALHLSFVVILAGALLTHLFSRNGIVHLRLATPTNTLVVNNDDNSTAEEKLPFSITLNSFNIDYHDGTRAESDYVSSFTVSDGNRNVAARVSMNKIFEYRSFRFYQSSYDEDMQGSILSVSSDPYGIPVTYTGYAMLFFSLLWMLAAKRGPYRTVLRRAALSRVAMSAAIAVAALCSLPGKTRAATVLPRETAEKFGELYILYNNRVCPLQTFAIDFTKKLYGKPSYKGLTAEQVLTGFIFWGDEWCSEPILKIKSGPVKETLQLPDYCSVNTFFNSDMGGYIIGPYVEEFYNGNSDKFHKQVADIDGRIQLVMELRHGSSLKIFPTTDHATTTWNSPVDKLPSYVGTREAVFIQNVFPLLYKDAREANSWNMNETLGNLLKYQRKNAGTSLPTDTQVRAERMYNAFPFATVLFMLNLTMGLLSLMVTIYRLNSSMGSRKKQSGKPALLKRTVSGPWWNRSALAVMLLSFVSLTLCEALRWIIRGKVPMGNGYETMLFVAWLVMLLSLVAYRRFHIILTFAFLMSGFFLLVSHINLMDPEISHLMPVLNSPLLSIHVSIIMMGFAMLSITFICGVTALLSDFLSGFGGRSDRSVIDGQMDGLRLLSLLFLYPALAMLGIGIFVGAIWANVSWGTYWSWDAKETWALITFMLYAIAVHSASLPWFRKPKFFHIFMVLAFLSILMTYFGVNYFLSGMHSYA